MSRRWACTRAAAAQRAADATIGRSGTARAGPRRFESATAQGSGLIAHGSRHRGHDAPPGADSGVSPRFPAPETHPIDNERSKRCIGICTPSRGLGRRGRRRSYSSRLAGRRVTSSGDHTCRSRLGCRQRDETTGPSGAVPSCGRGGTGRRTGFRRRGACSWGFDSLRPHFETRLRSSADKSSGLRPRARRFESSRRLDGALTRTLPREIPRASGAHV